MDDRRFDQLTRAVGAGASRRGVLKALLGGAAGALAGALRGSSADAAFRCRANGVTCLKNADCCSAMCGSKDASGRRYCGCTTAADCPAAPVCQVATCSQHDCGSAPDPNAVGSTCGLPATCDPNTNTQRTADACDANGQCAPGVTSSCGLFVCGSTACLTACASDNDCLPSAYCGADNLCHGDESLGQPCDRASECLSGVCSDGVCCDVDCSDECHGCDGPNPGTCTPLTGPACQSGTGVCVAGSCCPNALVCGSGASAVCGCDPETCCSGICTVLGTASNCAGCGDACAGGSDCCSGACTPLGTTANCLSCGDACSGTTPGCCASGCVDFNDNTTNCGSCGNNCLNKGFGEGACCGGDCVDLFTDVNHCGACGAAACAGTTPACCAGTCHDLDSDMQSCGACYFICDTSKVQNSATVTCAGGKCLATSCVAGYTLLSDGTCCLDANLCGSAPNQTCCGSGQTCCSGTCTDTSLDPNNCGGCGLACPAGVSCAGSTCAQGSFGGPCSAQVPCAVTGTCLNGFCCIPSGLSCTPQPGFTISGQCCSDPTQSCPSAGTCP